MKDEVYVVRVRGTSDFDLSYEVCQTNGEFDHFSVSVRRKIGLVRLAGDDRNDRDLPLIQGSALDRFLADKSLWAQLAKEIVENNVEEKLGDSSKEKLARLEPQFGKQALPIKLGLGLVGGQGVFSQRFDRPHGGKACRKTSTEQLGLWHPAPCRP